MRKRIVISSDGILSDFTCDDYSVSQAAAVNFCRVRFTGALDEDGDVVEEVIFAGMPFILSALAPREGAMVTIPLTEYEGLKETIAILSDPNAVADIKQAEADVAAGNLTDVQDLDKPGS
jgi:hypothetical protein